MVNAEITPSTTHDIGVAMHALITELFPICRSITGDGVRETLQRIGQHIPLEMHEVPSGTTVFDWTVPNEWNLKDAYIKTLGGERVIDVRQSTLHVLNYSTPINRIVGLQELREHLFTLPEQPDLIPYRTSYYHERWGFCLSHKQYLELNDPSYEVCIDATLEPGQLSYGECYLPGLSSDEVLISCHVCHPALCNDNLSGIALAVFLAKLLASRSRHYSYRFLFIPGTIGAITWLALNETQLERIKHGLVVACVGDSGHMTYKRSRRGDAIIDRAVEHVLKHSGDEYEIVDFSPYGYDERQYCSPGFNLPVGCLSRTPHSRFPEYHTSADNLEFVQPAFLSDSLAKYLAVVDVLEHNHSYVNLNPKCEPQLGKRGLYRALGGQASDVQQSALLWVLNLSDGTADLLQIAERAGLLFAEIKRATQLLLEHGLLREYPAETTRAP